jgi:hypothetical protein
VQPDAALRRFLRAAHDFSDLAVGQAVPITQHNGPAQSRRQLRQRGFDSVIRVAARQFRLRRLSSGGYLRETGSSDRSANRLRRYVLRQRLTARVPGLERRPTSISGAGSECVDKRFLRHILCVVVVEQ